MCTQADRGGSIRLGYLTEERYGFYAGYLWFKEFHADYIEYAIQFYISYIVRCRCDFILE